MSLNWYQKQRLLNNLTLTACGYAYAPLFLEKDNGVYYIFTMLEAIWNWI
jgi:hypothetical protein